MATSQSVERHAIPTSGSDGESGPASSDTLQSFTLDDLAQYTREGAFGPTASQVVGYVRLPTDRTLAVIRCAAGSSVCDQNYTPGQCATISANVAADRHRKAPGNAML
jgi:hypothetical protein